MKRDPERDGHGWERTVREDRRQIPRLLKKNPSLRHKLDEVIAETYEGARSRVIDKSEEMWEQKKLKQPLVEEDLPQSCPWDIHELLKQGLYFTREQLEEQMEPPSCRM
ncbi:DUF29 family protein [Verrucomicrobium sp. 3C]|uniref:DUF29 family protein n=1 Tax=Verrucomicrobium sp. 3C TaxID=1134055 RepID=UPI0003640A05|nr:DUF29 family protein [Verrucomicrobium sp. 3C]